MVRPPRGFPPGSVERDFEVVQEGWSEYEVHGGTVIMRGRIVLVRLFQLPDPRGQAFSAATVPIFAVRAQREEDLGEPENKPFDPSIDKTEPVDFQMRAQPWNVYRYRDGTKSYRLQIGLAVTGVSRVIGRFDHVGEPMYLAHHQALIGPPVPETPVDK